MYNFNKRIEKNRSKLNRKNKKVSKFSPVFLVLIITAISLTVLFKTGGFSKILNLIFKDPTYTSENIYAYTTVHEDDTGEDFVNFVVDQYYNNFSRREFLVDWQINLQTRSENFNNQDFLIVLDQTREESINYFKEFIQYFSSRIINNGEYNNRIAIRCPFGGGLNYDNYTSDLTQIQNDISSYRFVENPTNGYADALEFLNEHNPVSGRKTNVILITDSWGPYDKYKAFYRLIKNRYSNVTVHFGVQGPFHGEFPPFVRDNEDIADKYYYLFGWTLNDALLTGIDYYKYYTDVVITMKVSEYVDLIDYKDGTGLENAVEIYEEGGDKYIRLSFDKFDMYQANRYNLQTLFKLKDNVPAFVPLNGTIKVDFTTEDGIRRHATINEALVVASTFTVHVNPRTPDGCTVEVPEDRTYNVGDQAYYPEEPHCEGWEFLGWTTSNSPNRFQQISEGVFTGKGNINLYGTWSKITLTKKAS